MPVGPQISSQPARKDVVRVLTSYNMCRIKYGRVTVTYFDRLLSGKLDARQENGAARYCGQYCTPQNTEAHGRGAILYSIQLGPVIFRAGSGLLCDMLRLSVQGSDNLAVASSRGSSSAVQGFRGMTVSHTVEEGVALKFSLRGLTPTRGSQRSTRVGRTPTHFITPLYRPLT